MITIMVVMVFFNNQVCLKAIKTIFPNWFCLKNKALLKTCVPYKYNIYLSTV